MENTIENGMDVLFNDPSLLFISFLVFMICLTSGVGITKGGGLSSNSPFLDMLLVFTMSLVILSIILSMTLSVMSDGENWPKGTRTVCTAFMSIGGALLATIPLFVEWISHKIYRYKRDRAERLAREARQLNNNLKKNIGGYNS